MSPQWPGLRTQTDILSWCSQPVGHIQGHFGQLSPTFWNSVSTWTSGLHHVSRLKWKYMRAHDSVSMFLLWSWLNSIHHWVKCCEWRQNYWPQRQQQDEEFYWGWMLFMNDISRIKASMAWCECEVLHFMLHLIYLIVSCIFRSGHHHYPV